MVCFQFQNSTTSLHTLTEVFQIIGAEMISSKLILISNFMLSEEMSLNVFDNKTKVPYFSKYMTHPYFEN